MAEWHGLSLEEALSSFVTRMPTEWRDPAPAEAPCRVPGSTEQQVCEREQEIQSDLPAELHALHRAIRGAPSFDGEKANRHTFVVPLEYVRKSAELDYFEVEDLEKCGAGAREDSILFDLAATIWGEQIFYCEESRWLSQGAIYANDLERSQGVPSPLVKLADSLADWLLRFALCGFEERCFPFTFSGTPTGIRDGLIADHLRLNPGLTWPTEDAQDAESGDLR